MADRKQVSARSKCTPGKSAPPSQRLAPSTNTLVWRFGGLDHSGQFGWHTAARRSERAAVVNEVGLFAEEVKSISGELPGNFPQAFSHVGFVIAAG
jgi:hypothetical protein